MCNAATIRPGTVVTLPVPSGSYCVLELRKSKTDIKQGGNIPASSNLISQTIVY